MDKDITNEEMVAWVDEDERLMKAIPISLANSDPQYLHPEVAILLFDDKKRVLLQKRAATKKVMPGIWICSTAGHVTYGESVEVSAHRELQEELGFDIPLVEVTKILNTLPNERHIAHWFLGKYNGEKILLDPHETDAYEWVGQDELEEFLSLHQVSPITVQTAKRFWSGEWDILIK